MPTCRLCKLTAATVEMRRTKLGHVCKDKILCARRRSPVDSMALLPKKRS